MLALPVLFLQAADDEDAMLAAAIAASLQDTPGPAQQPQQQQQPRPQQTRPQQTAAGASISHPPAAAGQTPAGGLAQHSTACLTLRSTTCYTFFGGGVGMMQLS